MPYIEPKARKRLGKLNNAYPKTTGELNYCLTVRIKKYVESFPRLSYDTFNWIIGVLEEIKFDIQNRNWAEPHNDSIKKQLVIPVINYIKKFPHITEHEMTQIRGALTCTQLELYRRLIANYEDLKCKSNGDVYT